MSRSLTETIGYFPTPADVTPHEVFAQALKGLRLSTGRDAIFESFTQHQPC